MKVFWCELARKQFLDSLAGLPETLVLFFREKRVFLLAETLLQWIEDLAIYATGEIPHHGVVETCRDLGLSLTGEEEAFLREMEKASRKEESYREFVEQHGENPHFLAIIEKVASYQKRMLSQ